MTSRKLLGHHPEKNMHKDDKILFPELWNKTREQEENSSLYALKIFLN